jgi:hypothetical protein
MNPWFGDSARQGTLTARAQASAGTRWFSSECRNVGAGDRVDSNGHR